MKFQAFCHTDTLFTKLNICLKKQLVRHFYAKLLCKQPRERGGSKRQIESPESPFFEKAKFIN